MLFIMKIIITDKAATNKKRDSIPKKAIRALGKTNSTATASC